MFSKSNMVNQIRRNRLIVHCILPSKKVDLQEWKNSQLFDQNETKKNLWEYLFSLILAFLKNAFWKFLSLGYLDIKGVYIYWFCPIFQGLSLFHPLRLIWTLEYDYLYQVQWTFGLACIGDTTMTNPIFYLRSY